MDCRVKPGNDELRPINPAVTSFVYTLPTISPAFSGLVGGGRPHMRFKILASVVPLIALAVFARGTLLPGSRPCIAVGDTPVQIASMPWQAELHVSFTGDPTLATVRVQILDSAEAADFVVIDDIDSSEAGACPANAATRQVAISASASVGEPVIYLSSEGPADYRVFVRSKTFSVRDAAALIVGASGGHRRLVAASL
jgi:hypothetical protein